MIKIKNAFAWLILGLVFGGVASGAVSQGRNQQGELSVLDLAGKWEIAWGLETPKAPADTGVLKFRDALKLPGTMEQAGLGLVNTNIGGAFDAGGDQRIQALRQAGGVGQAERRRILMGLYRPLVYEGPAYYRREIEIPSGWEGKRVVLFLERVHWETRVWVDEKPVGGMLDSLIAPHVHELCELAPGKHTLTLCVDNTMKFNLGPFVSIISEHTQGNWNGVVGRIELQATGKVWIDDVQVYPDAAKKKVRVVLEIGNATGKDGVGRIQWTMGRSQRTDDSGQWTVKWNEKGGRAEFEIELGADAKFWDEFELNLHELKLSLVSPESGYLSHELDTRSVSFGLRDFGVSDRNFTVNGRKVFLRGEVDDAHFPLTGYAAMDLESWRRIMRISKEWGLNHLRFHSWTPPEAAFQAADEAGLYIQTEGPQANIMLRGDPEPYLKRAADACKAAEKAEQDAAAAPEAQRGKARERADALRKGADKAVQDANVARFVKQELDLIPKVYGNHPSFCMMGLGNELPTYSAVDVNFHIDRLKQADPRHVYTSTASSPAVSSGDKRQGYGEHRDFSISGVMHLPTRVELGTDNDGEKYLEGYSHPLIAHESGQFCVFPDISAMPKYSGVMKPLNLELISEDLRRAGMEKLASKFVEVTGKQSALYYKLEIEYLLRTAGLAGFPLLNLHDYSHQGTAHCGMLDVFWENKGFITPDRWRRFCSETVPLARIPQRLMEADGVFTAKVEVAHFGAKDLPAVSSYWKLLAPDGQAVASGVFAAKPVPTGGLTEIGDVAVPLKAVTAPARLRFVAGLSGTEFENDWDVWVYPKLDSAQPPENVTVCSGGLTTNVTAFLASGGRVLLLTGRASAIGENSGFKPIFWSPVWAGSQRYAPMIDVVHPLFRLFPTEEYCDAPWVPLNKDAWGVDLRLLPRDLKPLVRVIDGFHSNLPLASLVEIAVGKGKLIICGLNVGGDLSKGESSQRQLLRALYAYMGSDDFKPRTKVDLATLAMILPGGVKPDLVPKVLRASSECKGGEAARLFDGNLASGWRTPWSKDPAEQVRFPHDVVLDLGQPCDVAEVRIYGGAGFTDYDLFGSATENEWTALANNALMSNDAPNRILLKKANGVRFLKFVLRGDAAGKTQQASISEIVIECRK